MYGPFTKSLVLAEPDQVHPEVRRLLYAIVAVDAALAHLRNASSRRSSLSAGCVRASAFSAIPLLARAYRLEPLCVQLAPADLREVRRNPFPCSVTLLQAAYLPRRAAASKRHKTVPLPSPLPPQLFLALQVMLPDCRNQLVDPSTMLFTQDAAIVQRGASLLDRRLRGAPLRLCGFAR